MINIPFDEQTLLGLSSGDGRSVRLAQQKILLIAKAEIQKSMIDTQEPIEMYRFQGAARMVDSIFKLLDRAEKRPNPSQFPSNS